MRATGNKISLDTAKTVLVPAELFEAGATGTGRGERIGENARTAGARERGREYLEFNGMALADGETTVIGQRGDIIAVMGVETDEWSRYREQYERGEVEVTSPLLDLATSGDRNNRGSRRSRRVGMVLTTTNVCLAVWDNGLRMAEVLPDNSVDSILYYMQVVGQNFKLQKFEIDVAGDGAEQVADALRNYYKNVRMLPCE